MSRWLVGRRVGDAATLHAFEPPEQPRPTLVVAAVERGAIVLGSTQAVEAVDGDRAAELGLDVVRRRSGGSSVALAPGAQLWVDVWIPAGDPLWNDDVAAAAVPIGEAWARALGRIGWADLTVHAGGAEPGPWSELVCFAGRGPGEVFTATGRKLVGVSQRRTRDWIRLQCMVHRYWDAELALAPLALSDDERRAARDGLAGLVASIGDADEDHLVAALADALL